MRKFCTLALSLSVISGLVSPGFCGAVMKLHFLGFSEDGRYLAFETQGDDGMSNKQHHNVYMIDVDNNSVYRHFNATFIAPEPGEISRKPTTEQSKRMLARAYGIIKDLGINEDRQGDHVLSRSSREIYDKHAAAGHHTCRFKRSSGPGTEYEVRISTLPSGITGLPFSDIYGDPKLVTVELTNLASGAKKILQRDSKLPKSRSRAFNYALQDVYLQADKIAVVLAYFSLDIEGPGMNYIIVTGGLP